MIKPDSLEALFATCPDSKWVGDICRALGGQEVELDMGQQMMLAQVRRDSERMDEWAADQRERWKDRKRALRAKKNGVSHDVPQCPTGQSETSGDSVGHAEVSRDVPGTNECPPKSHDVTSIPTYLPTSLPITTTDVVVNKTPLTEDEMSYLAETVQVPAAYLQTFINRMTELGWQYITRSGVTVTVTRDNFKAVLRKFFEWDQRKKQQPGNPAALKQAGYSAEMEHA